MQSDQTHLLGTLGGGGQGRGPNGGRGKKGEGLDGGCRGRPTTMVWTGHYCGESEKYL